MIGRQVVFNGKFLSAPISGVHRVAISLLAGLDRIQAGRDALNRQATRLLAPSTARLDPKFETIPLSLEGRLNRQFWEQVELPFLARDALLISLCNLSPLAHPRAITMIHDAQVLLTPESYSGPFRAWYQFALPRIGRTDRKSTRLNSSH